jgi:hypothetical protein
LYQPSRYDQPGDKLNGDPTVTSLYGAPYTDAGVIVIDNSNLIDSVVTTITNDKNSGTTLDTMVAGIYTFHYNVADE